MYAIKQSFITNQRLKAASHRKKITALTDIYIFEPYMDFFNLLMAYSS